MFTKHRPPSAPRHGFCHKPMRGRNVLNLYTSPLLCIFYFNKHEQIQQIITRHSSEPFQLCVLNYFWIHQKNWSAEANMAHVLVLLIKDNMLAAQLHILYLHWTLVVHTHATFVIWCACLLFDTLIRLTRSF